MKLCNIKVDGQTHLALITPRGIVDVTAAGYMRSMSEVIELGCSQELERFADNETLAMSVREPVYDNVINKVGKLVCVGLNYRDHAEGCNLPIPEYPILFSKFDNALAPSNAEIVLPPWEQSYDYEAELVIVIGKTCWNVTEEEAMDYVFGYTIGNDLSLREAQMRSGQWLIGKSLPGFGPCGPCIVTADSYKPENKSIRCYVNGQLRQNGNVDNMIFNCAQIISYTSKYIQLEPGDLIFTGTPAGVSLEGTSTWLEPGDLVEVTIEGIGSLKNTMI